jgi:hypothetical protein
MGKVQDTISKIGERTRLRPLRSDIALLVPEQRPATDGSFPTSAAAVADYLDTLTNQSVTTDVDDTDTPRSGANATDLIRALQHTNRLVNTPAMRLKIARLFEPLVQRQLADLDAGFTGVDLPYPGRAADDFEQATTLLQEMSVSYKVILLDVLRRRGQLARKHRLPVIFQAMKHLSECALRYSQSYRPLPDRLWRDLNTLYLCAEREQGIDTVLRQSEHPQTIRQLYSQCCAFAACTNAHLPAAYQSQLYRQLGRLAAAVNLGDARDRAERDDIYSVALDSSHPPCIARYSRYQAGQPVRFFSMQPLLDRLAIDEAPIQRTHHATDADDALSANSQLSQMRAVVNGSAQRGHSRSVRQITLHTEGGLKEIHASLQTASHSLHKYGTRWLVENRSKGGLGLKWTGSGTCRVNVGGLIAHCEHTNATKVASPAWHIGIVRWIQCDGPELRCGVETLANYAAAVTVCAKTAATVTTAEKAAVAAIDRSATEALLLNDHPAASRPTMLLVPTQRYRLGEHLQLDSISEARIIRLTEHFPVGGNFHCFGFQAI